MEHTNLIYTQRDYAADMESEWQLFNLLELRNAGRLLDLGCGAGALVDICRKHQLDAYGCDTTRYQHIGENQFIYYREFVEIHFPTDHFDTIICREKTGRILDPVKFFREVFRVTAINGTCYCGQPEHFTLEQFESLLKEVGFNIVQVLHTDGNKMIFVAKKPEQHRIKLLLPPGVGDAYWSLVKTESFLEREGVTPPVDAYVAAPRAKQYDSHARSYPFLKMFPFLHCAEETLFNKNDPVWKEAYLRRGRSIFKNVLGCDYFITWNGYLRSGTPLDKINPEIKCNWFLPRFISLIEEKYRIESIKRWGNYILFYWVFAGTNKTLLYHFNIDQIASLIKKIVCDTGCTPIFVGAIWDTEDALTSQLLQAMPGGTIDLRGKTTIEELFGLIRGSRAVIGMNSGITIMSAVLGVNTMLLYHNYLFTGGVDRSFAWNTFPPSTRKKTYFAEFADSTTWEGFAGRAAAVAMGKPYIEGETAHNPAQFTIPTVKELNPHESIRNLEVGSHPANEIHLISSNPLIRWKKIGGGSFRMGDGRIIKRGQTFKATIDQIPPGFRDSIIPIDGTEGGAV